MIAETKNDSTKRTLKKNNSRKVYNTKTACKKFRNRINNKKSSKEIQLQKKLDDLNTSLEKVNSELEKYIYRASHDLRAPLVSVLGLINVIKITDNEKPSELYLEMMEGTIKKLDNTIKEIVYNASISRRIIEPETIDLELKLNHAIQHHRENDSTCRVNSIISYDIKEPFISDNFLIELIIHHLIGNCFRFRNLMVNRLILTIEIKTNRKELFLKIMDNGRGIKKEQLPQIFTMFNRSSSESAGLGLGLYTVQEAVHKLNGVLKINSSEGQGTTVSLTIPCI